MSSDNRSDRERMKEEYKEHYRKLREVKERLNRSEKTKNISDALKNMDTSQLTDTFDEFLFKVKSKLTSVEARLEVAMDSLTETDEDHIARQERDEELRRAKAKETLRQAKIEMGLLYNEIEQQAKSMSVKKTIGTRQEGEQEAGEIPGAADETGAGDDKENVSDDGTDTDTDSKTKSQSTIKANANTNHSNTDANTEAADGREQPKEQ